MRWILNWSLQFRALIFFVSALVVFIGATRLSDTRVDTLPEFAPPHIEIQTEALGLSAREVEDLVTIDLEELLSGTPWLRSIRSRSVPGLSSIVLLFEPGTDVMLARQAVQERLMFSYALPNVSKTPVMLNPLSATSRAMIIGISSMDLSLIDLSVLVRFTIKPKLMGVPGVANVAVWGQRLRQLQVLVDPDRLLGQGVTLDQVVKTAGNAMWVSPLSYLEASTPGTGGWIDTPSQRLAIQHTQPISSPADLAQVAVEGTSLSLGEVANVVEGHPPLIGEAIVDGRPGLLLVVEKLPQIDSREVIHGVDAALDSLRAGLPGVDIDASIFRGSSFVDTATGNFSAALLTGAALLALILLFLFYEWRAAILSAMAVLLSTLTAALVLYATGAIINVMVVAGYMAALVIIVDDAIFDSARILRRLREAGSENSGKQVGAIVVEALSETRTPLIYATLIIVSLVAPVFFMAGVSRAFFEPLATSYLLALLASFVVAVTATPSLASVLWRTSPGRREAPVRWLQQRYEEGLPKLIEAPRAVLITAGAIVIAGLVVWPLFGQALLPSFRPIPQFDEKDVQVTLRGVAGTSHPEMRRIVTRLSGELQSIPGVRNVAAHLGRAVTGDQVVDVDSAQIWTSIDPAADHGATLAAIEEIVNGYPGLERNVETYLQVNAGGAFTRPGHAIVVQVRGPDWEGLHREADRVKQALSDIDGLVNLQVESQVPEPQIEVRVDPTVAGKFGLKPGDVRRAAATIFSGLEVGSLFEQQKVFGVVVWSTPDKRNNLTNVQELLIDTPDGGHVRLGDVAEVHVVPTPRVIEREGISRAIDVVADVQGRNVSSVVADIEGRLKGMQFPSEYYPAVRAESLERQSAERAMLLALLAALVGIFLLLQACFRSWSLALATFIAVPASLLGAIIAVHASGNTILLGSLVGCVAVLSLAVRHCILFVRHCQYLELRGGETFGASLVQRAAREQFAPVLMTAVAMAVALSPFLYYGDAAGLEIVHPMAIIILCGLVTSTLLSLFVMPVVYLSFGHRPEPEMRLEGVDLRSAPNATR